MGCTSSSFTTRTCRRRGDASDGPQPPPNALFPKTHRLGGHTDNPLLGTTLVPCLLSSRQGCPPFWGDGARGALPATPATKPSWEKKAPGPSPPQAHGLRPSLAEGVQAGGHHNVTPQHAQHPILCSSSQPKTPQQCGLSPGDPWLFGQTAEACTPSLITGFI